MELKDSFFGDLVHLTPSGALYFSNLIENDQLLNIDKVRTYSRGKGEMSTPELHPVLAGQDTLNEKSIIR